MVGHDDLDSLRMISVPELYILVSGLSSSFKVRISGRRECEDDLSKIEKKKTWPVGICLFFLDITEDFLASGW